MGGDPGVAVRAADSGLRPKDAVCVGEVGHVYASMFGIGYVLYDRPAAAAICAVVVATAIYGLFRLRPWQRGEAT